MPRRDAYTKVEKTDQTRADHVAGMGDVAFRGFNCLNATCTQWIVVRDDEIGDAFDIPCQLCGFIHRSGDEVTFYNFILRDLKEDRVIEEGEFAILVNDYLDEALLFKYCIICNTLKPLDAFDRHAARKTQRQSECRLCKRVYNSIKNQTRTADRHREAAQKRRLYIELGGGQRLDSAVVFERFGGNCFKCGIDLTPVDMSGERHLDHTLPAVFLWPLNTENATLLCRTHNSEKGGNWPSEFYSDDGLRRLAAMTGIDYATLKGEPHFNPKAIDRLSEPEEVDALLTKYAPYMDEILRVRNRLLDATGLDIFAVSTTVSEAWGKRADEGRS